MPRLGVQVDVHYAFLSAFAHPTQRGYDLLYGSNVPNRMGQRDHYGEELVLLYLIAVAAAELEAFGRMSRRKPTLPMLDWEVVEREVAEARLATEYFRFCRATGTRTTASRRSIRAFGAGRSGDHRTLIGGRCRRSASVTTQTRWSGWSACTTPLGRSPPA